MRHYRAAEIKADPLSLASLVAWLEQQPECGTYNYINNETCPLARYFTAHGYQNPIIGGRSFTHGSTGNERWHNNAILPAGWDDIMHRSPWTFGAALARARAAFKELVP